MYKRSLSLLCCLACFMCFCFFCFPCSVVGAKIIVSDNYLETVQQIQNGSSSVDSNSLYFAKARTAFDSRSLNIDDYDLIAYQIHGPVMYFVKKNVDLTVTSAWVGSSSLYVRFDYIDGVVYTPGPNRFEYNQGSNSGFQINFTDEGYYVDLVSEPVFDGSSVLPLGIPVEDFVSWLYSSNGMSTFQGFVTSYNSSFPDLSTSNSSFMTYLVSYWNTYGSDFGDFFGNAITLVNDYPNTNLDENFLHSYDGWCTLNRVITRMYNTFIERTQNNPVSNPVAPVVVSSPGIVEPSETDYTDGTLNYTGYLKEIIRLLVLDINNDSQYNTSIGLAIADINANLNNIMPVTNGILNKLGDINLSLDNIKNTVGGGSSGGDYSLSLDTINDNITELGSCSYDFSDFVYYSKLTMNQAYNYNNALTENTNDLSLISTCVSTLDTSSEPLTIKDLSNFDMNSNINNEPINNLTFSIPYISGINTSGNLSDYSLTFDNHIIDIAEDFPTFDEAIKKMRKFLGLLLMGWFVVGLRVRLPAIIRGE